MANELLREIKAGEPDPLEISNRDRALVLIEEYDLEAQPLSVRGLVKRNSEKALEVDIKALDTEVQKHTDEYADHLQESWIYRRRLQGLRLARVYHEGRS